MTLQQPPEEIIRRFCVGHRSAEVTSLGRGNINDTFLIRAREQTLILQGINAQVFPDPQILISNLQHLSCHLKSQPRPSTRRWEEAMLIPARNGSFAIRDDQGTLWRALSYIQDSVSFEHAETLLQAEETGWALGHFHKRVVGLDLAKMQIPLPGFHSLPGYLNQYELVSSGQVPGSSPKSQLCMETIKQEQQGALLLDQALASGKIQHSIIHGDPKIANILFDKKSKLAISLIDLDTVGPGILQHDIGDCLRSVCNRNGEDSDPEQVVFDLNRCSAALKGYFNATGRLLNTTDKELIYEGIKSITFELGLRFFTDYLQGGIYFKCTSPEETLQKSLIQFALLKDIIAKKDTIRNLIMHC